MLLVLQAELQELAAIETDSIGCLAHEGQVFS